MMFERAKRQLDLLAESCAMAFGLRFKIMADRQWHAIGTLLVATTHRRSNTLHIKLFSILLMLGNTAEARAIASQIGRLAGPEIETALSTPVSPVDRKTWLDALDAALVNLLLGSTDASVGDAAELESLGNQPRFGSVIEQNGDLVAHLQKLIDTEDPLMAAIALTAISYLDIELARSSASSVSRRIAPAHWLLTEVIELLTGQRERVDTTTKRQTRPVAASRPEAGHLISHGTA